MKTHHALHSRILAGAVFAALLGAMCDRPAMAAATAAPASPAASASASTPASTADLRSFITAWRLALATPGGERIADLTAWPFVFEGRRLQRAAYAARAVPALFTPATRRCLMSAKPVAEDGRMVLFCGDQGFVIAPGRRAGGWSSSLPTAKAADQDAAHHCL